MDLFLIAKKEWEWRESVALTETQKNQARDVLGLITDAIHKKINKQSVNLAITHKFSTEI